MAGGKKPRRRSDGASPASEVPPGNGASQNGGQGGRPGRLFLDETGSLNQSGHVPLSRFITALQDRLKLFLARLGTCERDAQGNYLPHDRSAGPLRGVRVLWEDVTMVAAAISGRLMLLSVPEEPPVSVRMIDGPPRNAQPLSDVMSQIMFAIVPNQDQEWVSVIPAPTVEKLRTILEELDLHREAALLNEEPPAVGTDARQKGGRDEQGPSGKGSRAEENDERPPRAAPEPGNETFLSETDLAAAFGVNQNTLRRRLREWRPRHQNNDWIRVPNPRPRDPRFLYRVGAVRSLIDEIHSTGE